MLYILLDNINIFLNVLEQFGIRVTIFNFDVEDLIKYVNKLYFNNDSYVNKILKNVDITSIKPEGIVHHQKVLLYKELINDDIFKKAEYPHYNDIHFRFIY